jgi:biotin carboxyl carrier protein
LERLCPEVLELIYEGRLGTKSVRIEVKELPESKGSLRLEVKLQQGDAVEHYQFELLGRHKDRWTLDFDSTIEDVVVTSSDGRTLVDWKGRIFPVEICDFRGRMARRINDREPEGKAVVKAQMPGKVVKFLKKQGETVEAGEGVVVVEAMKMQNEMRAPKTGKVSVSRLQAGDSVKAGDVMFEIE